MRKCKLQVSQQAFLVLILLLILVLSTLQAAYGLPYVDVDVATAYNMINNSSFPDLLVLDVRTEGEYEDGHLDEAILIPVSELESRIGELASYKDNHVLVYCRTGVRSATASNILDSNNFTKVYNMLGGISAWESAGYPIIPEFQSLIILPLFILATLLACLVSRRRSARRSYAFQ